MNEKSINANDLSTMCRLCLSSGVNVTDIFTFSNKMGTQIANVIMNCASIQITQHDEMPNLICELCYIQLEKNHQFRAQVIQSDKTLRRYLHRFRANEKQIKTERFIRESSEDPLIHDTNIVNACESVETQDVFHINMNVKENLCQIFNSTTENNDEMCLKFEIKDEPVEMNLSFPPECTKETVESLSKRDDCETICTDSKINLKNKEFRNFKLADEINKNVPSKSEIKNEPMNDNPLFQYVEIKEETILTYDGSVISYEDVTEKVDKRIHTDEKPFQCNDCNRRFSRSQNLKIHKRTHTKEKPYRCDVCYECFSFARMLKHHKRTHTSEKQYKCDVCDMCFRQTNYLNIHKRTHPGEKPHKCDVCNKSFNRSSNLDVHKRTHTCEKPFKCDICNMCFSQVNYLKNHKRIHTGRTCVTTEEKP